MFSITLTSNGVAYNLYDLLVAANPQLGRSVAVLGLDIDASTPAAKVKVGSANAGKTDIPSPGVTIEAGKPYNWPNGIGGNEISLVGLFLKSDTNSTVINVQTRMA